MGHSGNGAPRVQTRLRSRRKMREQNSTADGENSRPANEMFCSMLAHVIEGIERLERR